MSCCHERRERGRWNFLPCNLLDCISAEEKEEREREREREREGSYQVVLGRS